MAAIENEGGGDFEDVTRDPLGPIEKEVAAVKKQGQAEQIEYLLKRSMNAERSDQREDDVQNDHGIRLFSRQKNQSLCKIFLTLFVLTVVYGVQVAALFNLNRGSQLLDTNVLIKWLERGLWEYPADPVAGKAPDELPPFIRNIVGGSELNVFTLPQLGFCLTAKGGVDVIFNVFIGLIMIYLFLFFDMWFVVFDMPLTRNFPNERHGIVMLMGVVWLVLLNTGIVTWLGVISGFAVIANSGDFYSVLFQSLQLFIILVIDDTVLPAVQFLVEETGHLDKWGNLKDEDLMKLTHGSQYYKPGYGHSFVKNLRGGEIIPKITSFIALLCLLAIIVSPAVVTIIYGVNTFVRCT